jgi:hypothetical protein
MERIRVVLIPNFDVIDARFNPSPFPLSPFLVPDYKAGLNLRLLPEDFIVLI